MSASAVRTALDLLHVPSGIRTTRASPLPDGMPLLLRLAAGDPAAVDEAVAATGRDEAELARAATFFIEQVLLAPESDSYRALGSDPTANAQDLRRNMASLLTWLHPDKDRGGDRTIFVTRVTRAWDDIKTPERRAAYDATLQSHRIGSTGRTRRRAQGKGRMHPGAQVHFSVGRSAVKSSPVARLLRYLFRMVRS